MKRRETIIRWGLLTDCRKCGRRHHVDGVRLLCPCWKMRLPKRKEK